MIYFSKNYIKVYDIILNLILNILIHLLTFNFLSEISIFNKYLKLRLKYILRMINSFRTSLDVIL